MKQKSRYCNRCEMYVLAQSTDTPLHGLHVVLAIITYGIWLVPWIFTTINHAIRFPYRCVHCGKTV